MSANPLLQLRELGQSIWFDNIERKLITSGELRRLIEEDGLGGVTSNPAIFEKAISGSDDYTDQLRELAEQGKTANEIYEALAVCDIQMAADALLGVYEATEGRDGFVSLECSPLLAHDTEGTVAEARRLWQWLDRKNVMIKIPGTPAGIPAIEQCIADGININITLLFSLKAYEATMEAYIRGLERRAAAGQALDRVASVASFFISRIDTAVDKQLEQRLAASGSEVEKALLGSLNGRIAIANAKVAYQRFKEIFHGERFQALREQGARVQRPLWASTSTKNPAYSDVYYIETLIGDETVNTIPPATFTAFRQHGTAQLSIEDDLDEERRRLERLASLGIHLDAITEQVLEEGVRLFIQPFEKLLQTIETRRTEVLGQSATSVAD